MIPVTRLNGTRLIVNAELVELVESTPDTILTLLTGRRIIVKESPFEVAERIIAYRRRLGAVPFPYPRVWEEGGEFHG